VVLLSILFGEKSIICQGSLNILNEVEMSRIRLSSSANPQRSITVTFYALDLEIQKLLRNITDPSRPLDVTFFQVFKDEINQIKNNALWGKYLIDIPALFLKNLKDKNCRVLRNANDDSESDEHGKLKAKEKAKGQEKDKERVRAITTITRSLMTPL
jgi:hypothetical protein